MKKIMHVIGFCFLGVILGLFTASIILNIRAKGGFVRWEILESKYKFEEIVDANSKEVLAKSSDKKLYDWRCAYPSNCNQWVETLTTKPKEAEFGKELPMDLKSSCLFSGFALQREPPGNVFKCARTELVWHESKTVTLYALLDDGTVWRWAYEVSYLDGLIFGCWGSFLGLILVLISLGARMIFQKKQMKNK